MSPKFSKLIMHCRQQRNIIIEEVISAVHCASFKIIDIVNSFADKTLPLSQSELSDILRTINRIISQRDPSVENNRERATSRYRIALNKNIFPIFRLFVPYTYFMLCNFFHCFKGDERKLYSFDELADLSTFLSCVTSFLIYFIIYSPLFYYQISNVSLTWM